MMESTENSLIYNGVCIPRDWSVNDMKIICTKITDGTHDTPKKTKNGRPYITALHVKDNFIDFESCYYLAEDVHKEIYKRCNPERDDVLLVNIGAGVATTALVNVDFEFSLKNVALLKPNPNKIIGAYLNYYQSFIKPRLSNNLLNGGAQPFLSLKQISKLKVLTPPLSEQKAIIRVLGLMDKAINANNQLIAQKELRKKWLMQNLLSGKKRLQGFSGDSSLKLISPFIKEISIRNKKGMVNNVLSVTNSRGFINQSEQFDRSVASKDLSNYKIVKKGQFAYNPSRVNVGSLDLLRDFEEGILSPMYVVFETYEKALNTDFFYYHLKSSWFNGHIPMFVQGSVRDSLSFDGLSGMKFFIPSLEEQIAIAQILKATDKEINILKSKTDKLKEQKKGMMQVLLTGKKRLKID